MTAPKEKTRSVRLPGPAPSKRSTLAPWLVSLLVPVLLAGFSCVYHVVLPSDDVLSVRVIRKQQPTLDGTVVFVPSFVDTYNRASVEDQQRMEQTYLYRRLVQTGIVKRTEAL